MTEGCPIFGIPTSVSIEYRLSVMKSIILVVTALAIIGCLVWFHARRVPVPPKAQLLCDLWNWVNHPHTPR